MRKQSLLNSSVESEILPEEAFICEQLRRRGSGLEVRIAARSARGTYEYQ